MRKSLSISALVVIFLAELSGFLGILYVRYCMDVQSSLFNATVVQVFDVQSDVEQIRSLLYKYEYTMTSAMASSQSASEAAKHELLQSELALRKQLVIHARMIQSLNLGEEGESLFRSVNDDVLHYLNYNAVILSMHGDESPQDIARFTETRIYPLMERVNVSTNRLSALSQEHVKKLRAEMDSYLRYSRFVSVVGLAVIVISIIVSIVYSSRVLGELEEKNRFFKSKSEASELRISEIQHNTIMGMADLVESRSGETGQHVKRTSHLVNMILQQAKKQGLWADVLTDEYIANVTRAAPMHDLGKIVIPDAILNKPGKLTDEEYAVMKTHAVAGGKIVRDIIGSIAEKDYVAIASDIAQYHHEKWNGTGYPSGKKGTEIPLGARIMAVADVFDALVSERCYKKPMAYDDAFALIEREAGAHFDPAVVAVFLELKAEIYAER